MSDFIWNQAVVRNEPQPGYYQRNFSLAILNWEINRQEERLSSSKTKRQKK